MITAKQIKVLRDRIGISIAECKRALEASAGNEEQAIAWLKQEGSKIADKKSVRTLGAGAVSAYIHSTHTLGALVELRSETDFVAKNEEFRLLADDLAMHIAALEPQNVAELLEQPFVKNPNQTVADVVKAAIQKFGERIEIGAWHRLDARAEV
ncbi:MAG: elongation factor Ts [Patescibacteria group bacterium]